MNHSSKISKNKNNTITISKHKSEQESQSNQITDKKMLKFVGANGSEKG